MIAIINVAKTQIYLSDIQVRHNLSEKKCPAYWARQANLWLEYNYLVKGNEFLLAISMLYIFSSFSRKTERLEMNCVTLICLYLNHGG